MGLKLGNVKRYLSSHMAGEVQIKQFQLPDQEALLSFLRVAYPPVSTPKRWSEWFW